MYAPLGPDPQQTPKKLIDYSLRRKPICSHLEPSRIDVLISAPLKTTRSSLQVVLKRKTGCQSSSTYTSICSLVDCSTSFTRELPISTAANENAQYGTMSRRSVHHVNGLQCDRLEEQTVHENNNHESITTIHGGYSNTSYSEYFDDIPRKSRTLSTSLVSTFHGSKRIVTKHSEEAGNKDDCIEFYLKVPPVHERQRLAKRSDLRERFRDPKRRGSPSSSSPIMKRSSSTLSQLLASLPTSDDK